MAVFVVAVAVVVVAVSTHVTVLSTHRNQCVHREPRPDPAAAAALRLITRSFYTPNEKSVPTPRDPPDSSC